LDKNQGFVETAYLKNISERALRYLTAGLSIHFSGPSGTGKTSLALKVAENLGRPYTIIYGNNDFNSSDLIGGNYGYRRKKTVDNFIHNVYTIEEDFQLRWLDNHLTKACRAGHVLVYDEFSRTSPTVNNILLSVLEEGVLFLPGFDAGKQSIKVHPEFRVIFTSNPLEYAGVHKTQAALEDRMVTIELNEMDRETEVAITMANSSLSEDAAGKVVDIVRDYRIIVPSTKTCTVRTCIKIARVMAFEQFSDYINSTTLNMLSEILFSESRHQPINRKEIYPRVLSLIEKTLQDISSAPAKEQR